MVPEIKDKVKHNKKKSVSSLTDSLDSLSSDSSGNTASKSPVKFLKSIIASGKTEVKVHFGLRKQTSSGKPNSVRPSPEQASKWSNSLDDLLTSKYGLALFKAFLQREFCEENLEFWLSVEEFRKSSKNQLCSKAQDILNDFILPQSPKEINIDSVSRENLINKMSEAPTQSTLFDQVQQRIRNIIETDAYIRFLKSDLYLELLHPEDYSTET